MRDNEYADTAAEWASHQQPTLSELVAQIEDERAEMQRKCERLASESDLEAVVVIQWGCSVKDEAMARMLV